MPLTSALPVQQSWIAPTLQNSWSNATSSPATNPAGYWKDSLGIVHLRGYLSGGNTDAVIFTLPTGYRPEKREMVGVLTRDSSSNNILGQLSIESSGFIILLSGSTSRLCLDSITFRAV